MNLLSLPLSCLYTVIPSASMGTHRSGHWEYSAQCMPSALELPQQNFKTICDSGYHMPDQMSIDLFHSDCSKVTAPSLPLFRVLRTGFSLVYL